MLSPSEAADIAELNQLAYRYAAAVDACDVDAFVSVFCPEARLSTFGPGADEPVGVYVGHTGLAYVPEAMSKLFTRTAHLMTNHLVQLDGDAANGSLLCTARHLHANGAGGTDLVVVIRYVDRYERRQDRWLILDREIRFLWSETHATLTPEQSVELLQGRRQAK
jgi:ketosteroid isomerase-like protein